MSRRGNNEGSIYKRSNGTYRAQISLDGRRLSFTARTRAECQQWIRNMRDQIDNGLTMRATRMTVAEFMEHYIMMAKTSLRPKVAIQYAGIVKNHILPEIGDIRLMDLRSEHVDQMYKRRLEAGFSNRTVRMIHSVLHRAMNKALEMGYLSRNPVNGATPPRLVEKEMVVLTEEQAYQFLITARDSRHYALYHLAIKTGMRQGEILGLMWNDINWRTGMLQVKRQLQRVDGIGYIFGEPKTKSGRRSIQLGQGTLNALRDHQLAQNQWKAVMGDRWQENNLIFPTTRGTPLDLHNLLKDFKEVLRKAGLPEIRFHDLRHTAASIMLQRNVPVFTVSKILGHSKPSVTLDIYGHLIPGALAAAAQAMEEALTPVAIQFGVDQGQMVESVGANGGNFEGQADRLIAPELHPKK